MSTNAPFVPKLVAATSVVPSGFVTETLAEVQHEVPIVTLESRMLMRLPATPSNTSRAFSPGADVVTVTGEPPGTIGYAAVAVPETPCVSLPPAETALATRLTAPALAGTYSPV